MTGQLQAVAAAALARHYRIRQGRIGQQAGRGCRRGIAVQVEGCVRLVVAQLGSQCAVRCADQAQTSGRQAVAAAGQPRAQDYGRYHYQGKSGNEHGDSQALRVESHLPPQQPGPLTDAGGGVKPKVTEGTPSTRLRSGLGVN